MKIKGIIINKKTMNSKSIVITVAIALIMGGVGFYGGMAYEKNSLAKSASGRTGLNGGNYAGRNGGSASTGTATGMRGVNGGGFIAGQITAKDDKSITVKDRNGSSKIILYSASATVGKTVDGSASDLATGQSVMVTGTTNSDGSVTAQNIQIRPDTPAGNGGPTSSVTN